MWQVEVLEPTFPSPQKKPRLKRINTIRSCPPAENPATVACCVASKLALESARPLLGEFLPDSTPSGTRAPAPRAGLSAHQGLLHSRFLGPEHSFSTPSRAGSSLLVSPQMPPYLTLSLTKSTLQSDFLSMKSKMITFRYLIYVLSVLPVYFVSPTRIKLHKPGALACFTWCYMPRA